MHIVAIGGSDAGISAALRVREIDPTSEVTVVVADAYPNFSICGIPYYVSGEVTHWRNLAHRTLDDLKKTGMQVRLNTIATKIDVAGRRLQRDRRLGDRGPDRLRQALRRAPERCRYGQISTASSAWRPSASTKGYTFSTSMGDTFDVMKTLEEGAPASAVIVGAGYIGS